MSQTNTNTNTGSSNTNRNQIIGKGGRDEEALAAEAVTVAEAIVETTELLNICLKKMKDGCISKLAITETRYRVTQYKQSIDTLPVLCVDKNYRYINGVLYNWTDLD